MNHGAAGAAAARRVSLFDDSWNLSATDARAPPPPGFRGRLWAPQATLLQAMLDLEDRGCVEIAPGAAEVGAGGVGAAGADPLLLRTRFARVAAEFSFGKTVLCIALVCAAPRPRAVPATMNIAVMDVVDPCGRPVDRSAVGPRGAARRRGTYVFQPLGRGVFPTLTVRHRRLVRATLVVAAPAVISQWEACVREFAPALAVFTIENVHSLRKFAARFRAPGGLAGVDLVLVKAGRVTANFTVEGEAPPAAAAGGGAPRGRQRSLTRALYMVTEGCTWARMIVDDFDTIRLCSDDVFLPSLFTWVISATRRATTVGRAVVPGATPADFLRNNLSLPVLGAACDGLFDGALKITCDPDYVRDHINSTTIGFRRLVVAGGRAVRILEDLGVPADVLEMAAAGAIETAAERLDIKVASVGDLVARVLAGQAGGYRKAVRALARAAAAGAAARAAAGAGRPANEPDEVKAIRKALKGGDDAAAAAALARVGAPAPPLAAALKSLKAWAEGSRDEFGGRLRRMRDNVRQAHCQGCMVPIGGGGGGEDGDEDDAEDGAAYIVNCCQVVICNFCTVVAAAGPGGARRYIDRCPNCAAPVDPPRDLIYVGADLGLETVLSDEALLASPAAGAAAGDAAGAAAGAGEGDAAGADEGEGEDGDEDEGEDEDAAPDAYAAWRDDPRLRALLQLVDGARLQTVSDEETPPFVGGLLEGARVAPRPAGAPHKHLIFAMHAESARQIAAGLAARGVEHVLLRGTRAQKDETIRRFRAPAGRAGAVGVMVIASNRDCAGLHLPEVTRLVFYHRHGDEAIARQAAGRAQRVGREFSLEIVEILSEGEADRLA